MGCGIFPVNNSPEVPGQHTLHPSGEQVLSGKAGHSHPARRKLLCYEFLPQNDVRRAACVMHTGKGTPLGHPHASPSVTSTEALQNCPWHPKTPHSRAVGSAWSSAEMFATSRWFPEVPMGSAGAPEGPWCSPTPEGLCASSYTCVTAKHQPALTSHPELLVVGFNGQFLSLGSARLGEMTLQSNAPWHGHEVGVCIISGHAGLARAAGGEPLLLLQSSRHGHEP